jgi:hypothetical protein
MIIVGLLTNFVACQGFNVPAYRLTLPMCVPIGIYRDVIVVGVRKQSQRRY